MTIRLITNETITFRDVISHFISNQDIVEGYIQEVLVNESAMIPLSYKEAIVKRLLNKYDKKVSYGGYYPSNTLPTHLKIYI